MPDAPTPPQYLLGTWDKAPPTHRIATHGQLFGFIGSCPHAQTLEAYSGEFRCTVWIALPCKQWSCRHCAETKIRQLAARTREARPNRLVTLTVDPSLWDSPRHAFDGTRRQVPECMRTLRTKLGELEYLRVTELTRRGWPHYHLMVRSPYLPHPVLKKRWQELTGAQIVDVRQVKDHFNTYSYLVKYLSKMHKIGWTERHVSYSRHFFPDRPEDKKTGLDLKDVSIIECHPSTYLISRFRGATLTCLGVNLFAIQPDPDAVKMTIASDPWSPEPEPDPPKPSPPPPRPRPDPPSEPLFR